MDKVVITEEMVRFIPMRFESHLAMEDEHCTTYSCMDTRLPLRVCHHVPMRERVPHGRTYSHYMLNGHVYCTRKAFIEALSAYVESHGIDMSIYDTRGD